MSTYFINQRMIILQNNITKTSFLGQYSNTLSIYRTFRYPSVFATNNLIRCFARSHRPHHAVALYSSALRVSKKPNNHTFTFLLQAFAKAVATMEGA